MRKLVGPGLVAVALAAAAGWALTAPATLDAGALAAIEPDLERGRAVFYAGGCAACHSAPDAKGEDKLLLGGGRGFPSDFGTFYAPNISPHPKRGIGGWSALDLANALIHGSSPEGRHYFPAFPYTGSIPVGGRMTP